MRKKNRDLVAIILALVFCALSLSACGKQEKPTDPTPTPSAEPKQNSFVLKDLPEGVSFDGANKYIESVDLYDEDSVGSEYWKVRVCSEEEQAKGNVFETDYFFFGEPKNENGRYALRIKPEVKLPANLYLGWLFCAAAEQEDAFNFDPGYYVPEGTFEGRTEIEIATIPDVASIASQKMFANCINLKKVYFRSRENWWMEKDQTFSGGVTNSIRICAGMFANCVRLYEVIFSSVSYESGGGVSVCENAFLNCVSLRKISFPGFVKYLEERGQSRVETVVAICGDDAFKNCINFGPADENQTIRVNEYADGEEPEF